MKRHEQNAVASTQADVSCLGALLKCVRVASESGQPQALIESALSTCEEIATAIAERMENIPGFNSPAEGEA